ncbi:hypothetical protein FRC07_002090 [Ceratobasidium sp. 392]|nr:hypothetical protein FRC07_002090 [Ceratobasidium sp. 392]
MQSIIGYSDDDRSDDEVKRPSPLRTLTKQKSKDTALKPISTTATKASTSAAAISLPNVSLTLNTLLRPAYGRGTPSIRPSPGSSMFRDRNQGIVRTLILLPNDHERETSSTQQTPVEPSLQDLSLGPNATVEPEGNELAQIRALLQPPPISGVENFGIPPPSEDKVDPELAAKVSKFLALKKQGTHFNDILMRNKSFNNPHIYAKLVDFVDVDETGTNFPKNMWNPHDIQPEWYAEELATAQKQRSAEAAAAQAPGKRSRIAFNNASASTSTSGKHPSALPDKSRQPERDRKSRVEGGREAGWSSGSGSNRHHPYPRKNAGDTNMGWMPKNHGERPGRW